MGRMKGSREGELACGVVAPSTPPWHRAVTGGLGGDGAAKAQKMNQGSSSGVARGDGREGGSDGRRRLGGLGGPARHEGGGGARGKDHLEEEREGAGCWLGKEKIEKKVHATFSSSPSV